MGEEDVKTENNDCEYACDKKDYNCVWDTYCMKTGNCQYQRNIRDCDGDIISLCRK